MPTNVHAVGKGVLVNHMQFETTAQFEDSTHRLRKQLPHFQEDFERLRTVLSKESWEDVCKRKYDCEEMTGMPQSQRYKGYKLRKFRSVDLRGKNGVRLLICEESKDGACEKIYFVDIRNDPDHRDQRVKNEITTTMAAFLKSKISQL